MGDYNPNSPSLIGSEWSPQATRAVDLGANPLTGIAMRINPGAITPSNAYLFQRAALNSLLGVEIVDTVAPTDLTAETIFPGTDTGKIAAAAWVDETGAANAFGKVSKNNDDTTYLALTGGVADSIAHNAQGLGAVSAPSNGGPTPLVYRGNRSATYASGSQRVASVTLNARVASSKTQMVFQFALSAFGGATKFIVVSGAFKPVSDGGFRTYSITLPGDPWLLAELNSAAPFYSAPHQSKTWDDRVTTSGPYGFGIIPTDLAGSGGGTSQFKVSGMWMTVNYCTENRRYNAYPRALVPAGWSGGATLPLLSPSQRVITFTSNSGTTALTTPTTTGATNKAGDFTANDVGAKIVRASDGQVVGTILSVTNSTTAVLTANGASTNASVDGYLGTPPTALSANTYYYAVLAQVAWNAKSQAQLDVPQDPAFVIQTDATLTGNHRSVYNLALTNAGSFVASSATQTTGEMLPLILTTGGLTAQNAESQAVARLLLPTTTSTDRVYSGNGNAQQATGAASTTYSAVKVLVSRASATLDPDQPLTVEIRHGAGALTGGGTLDATATIYPNQLQGTGNKATTIEVAFAASFASILNQQYVVYFKSTAKSTRAWGVVRLDSRSDLLNGAVTTAIVEGAGIGGTTDGWAPNTGTVATRYDTAVALCAAPSAPTGLAATAQAAA